jgi:phosphate-selective porin OprO/OprP
MDRLQTGLSLSTVIRRAAGSACGILLLLGHASLLRAQAVALDQSGSAGGGSADVSLSSIIGADAQATRPGARWLAATSGERVPAPEVAAAAQPAGNGKAPSTYDRIWRFAQWYQDDSNPVVQRVLFSGRYQHEFAALDADEGALDEWNVRRMRLGPRITLFRRVTAHAEVELNPQEHDPFYMRFTDAYVQWTRNSALAITAGKQGVPFTMDGATSSKELLTIDRSALSNNMWFPQEYMPGVSVSGRRAPWVYRAGLYSAGAANRELGNFSGGLFTLGVLGYDFAAALGMKEALLSGNYVYQHPDADNTFTRRLEHVTSVNVKMEADRWGLRADVSAASGYLGQSGLWGLMAMPFVNVSEALQIVGRYTFLDSSGVNGVTLGTYENRIVRGRGDRFNEVYAGANYYFYGHKLKVQTGLQVADMDDRAADGGAYSGVSWTTGIRVGW